jgi:hypothetical protein
LEGSGRVLIQALSQYLPGVTEGKPRKTSVKIAGVPAEIRPEHLPDLYRGFPLRHPAPLLAGKVRQATIRLQHSVSTGECEMRSCNGVNANATFWGVTISLPTQGGRRWMRCPSLACPDWTRWRQVLDRHESSVEGFKNLKRR